MSGRKKQRRKWPVDLGATIPACFAMSAAALQQIGLKDREAMNAIHTQDAALVHLETVMGGLAVGYQVAVDSGPTINGIEVGREHIRLGVKAAYDAVHRAQTTGDVGVPPDDRMAMERALRVVEQLREVALRRHWLAAYQGMQDTATFASTLRAAGCG